MSLLAAALLAAGPRSPPSPRVPVVQKVEPPSWWPGHSLNPVRLMVRGTNLGGAAVSVATGSGLTVGLTRVNAAGSYLFVDVAHRVRRPPPEAAG